MFADLSDIDETAQAKVGAEIWTVKSDKAPHSKGTKSKFSLFFMDYWSLRSDRCRRCSLC